MVLHAAMQHGCYDPALSFPLATCLLVICGREYISYLKKMTCTLYKARSKGFPLYENTVFDGPYFGIQRLRFGKATFAEQMLLNKSLGLG